MASPSYANHGRLDCRFQIAPALDGRWRSVDDECGNAADAKSATFIGASTDSRGCGGISDRGVQSRHVELKLHCVVAELSVVTDVSHGSR